MQTNYWRHKEKLKLKKKKKKKKNETPKIIKITIKHLQMNPVIALNNPEGVDMQLILLILHVT